MKKFFFKKNKYGYFQVSNPPTSLELKKYYRDKYFNINPRYAEKTKDFEEEYFKNQSLIKFNFIKKYLKKKPNVLDLGAGTGRFIYYISKFSNKVVGVDFSNKQLKYKLNTNTNFISEEPIEYISKSNNFNFQIITLNNIIEHALEPTKIFTELKKKITKKALVLVSLPNDFSKLQMYLNQNKLIKKKYWLSYPDHLNYFNSQNFKKYINSIGFKIIDAIADFPIELLLFEKNFNYIEKPIGKNAHSLRCHFVNYLCRTHNMNDIINFFKSLYLNDIGRNNYFLLKKNE